MLRDKAVVVVVVVGFFFLQATICWSVSIEYRSASYLYLDIEFDFHFWLTWRFLCECRLPPLTYSVPVSTCIFSSMFSIYFL